MDLETLKEEKAEAYIELDVVDGDLLRVEGGVVDRDHLLPEVAVEESLGLVDDAAISGPRVRGLGCRCGSCLRPSLVASRKGNAKPALASVSCR